MAARRAKRSRGRRGEGSCWVYLIIREQSAFLPAFKSQGEGTREGAHRHTPLEATRARWKVFEIFSFLKHRIYIGKAMLLETAMRGGWVRGIAEIRATLEYLSTETAEKEHPCRCGGPTSKRLLQEGPATCPA